LRRLHEEVLGLQTKVLDEERKAHVDVSRPINADLKGVALAWAEGDELGDIAQRSRIAEGDIVGLLQKTLDIIGQLRAAVDRIQMPARRSDRIDRPDLLERLAEADALIRRGVVEESYRWAVSGPPDPEEGSDDWELPPDRPPEADPRDRGPRRPTGARKPPPRGRGPRRPPGRIRPKR
jgi:hypothetical protein